MKKFFSIAFILIAVISLVSFFLIDDASVIPTTTVEATTSEIANLTSEVKLLKKETTSTTKTMTTEAQTETRTTQKSETVVKTMVKVVETTKKVPETTKRVPETTKEVTTTKIAVKTKKTTQYSDDDIYLFAQILYAEAGGCSKDEMAKVGQVVLNRINTDYWEFKNCKTIYDVVSQKGNYPETLQKIRNGIIPSKDAIKVAKGLLNGTINSGLANNVLWQTGFVPSWNVTVVLKTEWHYYSVLAD